MMLVLHWHQSFASLAMADEPDWKSLVLLDGLMVMWGKAHQQPKKKNRKLVFLVAKKEVFSFCCHFRFVRVVRVPTHDNHGKPVGDSRNKDWG